MTEASRRSCRDAHDVAAGPLLERALHVFDRRLGPERAHAANLSVVILLFVASALIVVLGTIGFVFFIGAGTEWLRDRVAYFDVRPRLAAIVATVLAVAVVVCAFAAGRATAGRNRDGAPRA